MNKDKWLEVIREELDKLTEIPLNDPTDWPKVRPKVNEFVKNVDEATEVYEQENTQK